MVLIHFMENISESSLLSCLLLGLENINQNLIIKTVINELIKIDDSYENIKDNYNNLELIRTSLVKKKISQELFKIYILGFGIPESVLPKSLDSFYLFMYSTILSVLLEQDEKICISGLTLSPDNETKVFGLLSKYKKRLEISGSKISMLFSFILGSFFSVFDSQKEYKILEANDIKDIYDSAKINRIFKIKNTRKSVWETDEIIIMETNIDDMTPELLSLALEEILKKGALDFLVFPVNMKKGRSAVCVQILCYKQQVDELAEIIFEWTTTFGIRMYSAKRLKLKREIIDIDTPYGNLKFKKGIIRDKLYKLSPEFEELKKLSIDNQQSPITLLNNIYKITNK